MENTNTQVEDNDYLSRSGTFSHLVKAIARREIQPTVKNEIINGVHISYIVDRKELYKRR